MKMMTRMMAMLMAALMCLCATASAETVLKLGTTVNEQDSFQVAAEKFAELVEAGTDGAYKIEIYPNGTLGGEAEMLDDHSGTVRVTWDIDNVGVEDLIDPDNWEIQRSLSGKEDDYVTINTEVFSNTEGTYSIKIKW